MLFYFCHPLYILEFSQHHLLESPFFFTRSSFPLHRFLNLISACPCPGPFLRASHCLAFSPAVHTGAVSPQLAQYVVRLLHFCQRDQWKIYARLCWVTLSLSLISVYSLCLFWACFTLGMMVFFFTYLEEFFICKEYYPFVISCKYFFFKYLFVFQLMAFFCCAKYFYF